MFTYQFFILCIIYVWFFFSVLSEIPKYVSLTSFHKHVLGAERAEDAVLCTCQLPVPISALGLRVSPLLTFPSYLFPGLPKFHSRNKPIASPPYFFNRFFTSDEFTFTLSRVGGLCCCLSSQVIFYISVQQFRF